MIDPCAVGRVPACGARVACGLVLVAGIALAIPATAAADRFDPTRPQVISLEGGSDYPRAVVLDDGTILAQWFKYAEAGTPSRIVACRIPPGGAGCSGPPTTILGDGPQQESALLQPDPDGDPDSLYAVARRTEGTGFVDYARTSSDGGRTFSPAVKVAVNSSQLGRTRYVHGPGAFSFSSLSFGFFQSAQFAGGGGVTSASARLQPPQPSSSVTYWEGVGRADSTTPVVVFETDEGAGSRLFSRRFTGSGSVNDAASWTPMAVTDPPRGVSAAGVVGLASGLRGLFIGFIERQRSGCGARFVVARYSGSTFGDPVAVDADPHASEPGASCTYGDTVSFGGPIAFAQDPAGNLRALWTFVRTPADPSAPDGMYSAVSADGGQTWTNPIRLFDYAEAGARLYLPSQNHPGIASNSAGDAVALGRGAPGGGAQLVRLPSIAASFAQPGPPAPGGGPAPPRPPGSPVPVPPAACAIARFGAVRALATVGCFTRRGSTYRSTGPVRVNGIDLAPAPANARAAAAAEIVLDQAKNTITTSGSWRASASAVDLGRQVVNWYVPPAGGQLLDAVTREPAKLDAASIKQRVLGLPASGLVLPSFLPDGTAKLPMNLQLPSPLGGLTGGPLTDNVTLTTDNGVGVRLGRGALSIELPTVSLGIAEISPFKVTYQADPFVFRGDLGIKLPLIGGGIRASLLLRDGEFVDATAQYTPVPPIPLTGFAFLTQVGLHVHKGQSCTDPTALEVNGRVSAGPQLAGSSLLAVRGSAGYKLPEGSCNRPGVFRIQGTGELVNLSVGQVFVQYVTDGTLTFGAQVILGSPANGLSGGIDGAIAFDTGDFYARGQVKVSIANYKAADVTAVVGSTGIGACAELDLLPFVPVPLPPLKIDAGAKYRWSSGDLTIYLENCDVSDLIPARFAQARAAQGATPPPATVRVAPGTKVQTFVGRAAGRAPQFTLVAPNGTRYQTTTPTQGTAGAGAGALAFTDDVLRQASITVKRPAPGLWRLEPAPDSAAFTAVEGAAGGDAPKVSAKVRRLSGRTFAIDYKAALPPAARVTFFDSAGNRLVRPLPSGRGTVRFASTGGKRGRRAVIARVEGEAGPLTAPLVGQFSAPGTPALGRPSRVQLRRGKGRRAGVRVTWRPATGASRYVMRAVLRDGRQLELPTSARRRVAVIPSVPNFDTAKVSVFAVGKDGRVGRPATARLKAVKVKPKKKKTPKRTTPRR